MKIFKFQKTQRLPITLEEAWAFFSTPKNLDDLTPPWVHFKITSELPEKMYAGMIATYSLRFYGFIPVSWMTEITHVEKTSDSGTWYFVDEQRFGPYTLWHHQHHFKPIDPNNPAAGTECIDIVHYALPFWIFGQIAEALMVRHQLKAIFDYRFEKLTQRFGLV